MGEANGEWTAPPCTAGSIKRIRVENFMCHSSLSLDLVDRVNFITGQNGSGKSAILTALCVAFGIKARGTQRATSLKDFIKNGQSYGAVVVDIKNEGADAFKPNLYGKVITVERRITESGQSFTMKDERGKKVAHKREDLQELLDHFNIEVENPCVIMTQDKSREFLHAGSGKEKFKFFFKATLLQQVSDILDNIKESLKHATGVINEIQDELKPFLEELKSLEQQIKSVQQIEVLAQQRDLVRKKLGWSWVYTTEEKLQKEEQELKKLQTRIPTCQKKIDDAEALASQVQEAIQVKQASIQQLVDKANTLKDSQTALEEELREATRERARLDEDLQNKRREIARKTSQLKELERIAAEQRDKRVQSTQAQTLEREQQFRMLEQDIEAKKGELGKLVEQESELQLKVDNATQQFTNLRGEMDDLGVRVRDMQGYLNRINQSKKNVVTTFGGERVLRLLQNIEQQQRNFTEFPIGPIGSHLTLEDATWTLAVEVALGKLLDAFIVTNHRDMLQLRQCAQRSGYGNLQIIINDFRQPLHTMPPHMLPDRDLVTVMSVLQTENTIVRNTLIDQGSVERLVLAADYDEGKRYAFGRTRISQNIKEVLTKDGLKLFSRGGSETTLPRDRRVQGRLGVRLDEQEDQANAQLAELNNLMQDCRNRKRSAEDESRNCHAELQGVKRRKTDLQRYISSKEIRLRDMQEVARAELALQQESDGNELEEDIARAREEIEGFEEMLTKMQFKVGRAQEKVNAARVQFDGIRETTREDIDASEQALNDLVSLQEELTKATSAVTHFQKVMEDKVMVDIRREENIVNELKKELAEFREKALQICPEEDVIAAGGVDKTTQELSALLQRLKDRVRREEEQNEPLEELERKRNHIEKRVFKKELMFKNFCGKLDLLNDAWQKRFDKFIENAKYLRRQLTWQFNGHLHKKGFSGSVKVDYEKETLSLEVQMPQDASGSAVRDTRALSGGERSYSTLAFALALHEMTEAPFRAMDEFDVFMDAVSRKISLDTVVDFAVQQGSQWIFITPHDISTVKAGPFVRKQQMSAPRP